MKVSAKDKKTGKENNITIKANSGLSESEIENMIRDAEANADADKKQRELVESRNTAEHQLWGVEKTLKEHGDKLTEEQKSAVEEGLQTVREAIAGDDSEKIQSTLQETFPKFMPLMELSQQAGAAAEAEFNSGSDSPGAPNNSDQVVDAEFTEVKENK